MRPTHRSRWGWLLLAGGGVAVGLVVWFASSDRVDDVEAEQQTQVIFQRAARALQRDDIATARTLLEQCLSREPEHVMARLYYGQILRDAGETARALETWHSITTGSAEERATARFLEASIAVEAARPDQARDLLEQAVRLNPRYVQAREDLVSVYRMLRRSDAIAKQLEALRSMRPLSTEELVLLTIPEEAGYPAEQSLPVLAAVLEENPTDRDSRLAFIRVLRSEGEFDRALASLRTIGPTYDDDNNELLALEIQLLIDLDRYDEVRPLCERIDRNDEPGAETSQACGRLAHDQQRWQAAFEHLLRAFDLDPNDRETCYLLGLTMQHFGDEQQAERLLRRATHLDNLQRMCIRVTHDAPPDPRALLPMFTQIATDLEALERFSESADWYERASQIAPQDTELSSRADQMRQRALTTTDVSLAERLSIDPTQPLAESRPRGDVDPVRVASSPVDSSAASIRFFDVHDRAGIDHHYFNGETGYEHLIESMGGGVIVVDFDADGWHDIHFPQGCRLPYDPDSTEHVDRTYRNLAAERYAELPADVGLGSNRYGMGGTAWDYDNDGFDDLVVSNFGRNDFYHNNGDGTWSRMDDSFVPDRETMSTSVATADFNGDGWLDLYIANYVTELKVCPTPDGGYLPCDPASFEGEPDQLLLNDGAGHLRDVSRDAGIDLPNGKGLGVIAGDLDDDGRVDLYVANDGVPNFLFRNITATVGGMPAFVEQGLISGTALDGQGRAQAGMGIALGDFDHDSRPDLYVTNFYREANTLYENQGDLLFIDQTRRRELVEPTHPVLGFGTQAADFDVDGDADLIVANGHILHDASGERPWKMAAQLFRNTGGERFADTSSTAGAYFGEKTLGRGVAILDWNHDRQLDVAIVHQDRPIALLENRTHGENDDPPACEALAVRLVGTQSSRSAIGASLRVIFADRVETIRWASDGGYLAANARDRLLTFTPAARPTSLEVRWPSGRTTEHTTESIADRRTGLVILTEAGRTLAVP